MTGKQHQTDQQRLHYKMSRIKSRETSPEIIVRSVLHQLGYRFRKHVKKLPGKPDIVLPKYKTVIFVHGCFWHQHHGCPKCKVPKSNIQFWTEKLNGNIERDRLHHSSLVAAGWRVLVIWECETKNRQQLQERLLQMIKEL
jgi:DNA mismatch endonuclease (patch repair protein)